MARAQPPADETPYHEIEIERALIGRVSIGDHGRPVDPPAIPPSRFYDHRHRLIWAAILDQHRKGQPTDLVSVASVLRERGQVEQAGGQAYLGALNEAAAGTAGSVAFYAARIRAAAAVRVLAPVGERISRLALRTREEGASETVAARYRQLVRYGDALCDMASRNGHSPTLVTRTVHEILTSPAPPQNWIYDPWLGAGEIVILAGEPGLGKSWLALDLMFALALGRPWATKDPQSGQQRVLYVDEENNYRLVRHRIGKLVDGLDIGMADLDPAKLGAAYAIEQGVNFDDVASVDLLKRKVEQLAPQWLIFDSLVRIHRRDENSNAEMAELIGRRIKPLAHDAGAGAIIVHHLGKATKDRPEGRIADRIRGASDIRGVADQVWGLERLEDGLLLTHLKCRMDRESSPVALMLEDVHVGNGLKVSYEVQEPAAAATIDSLLSLVEQAGVSRKSIIAELESAGMKAAARVASKHLGDLHRKGAIRKLREGNGVRYWLMKYAPAGSE